MGEERLMADTTLALNIFADAMKHIAQRGSNREVEWQRSVDYRDFGESDLLRQSAWVVLCSGFRVSRVEQIFDHISLCFCDWESAHAIVSTFPACRDAALASFRHRSKLDSIVEIARRVNQEGFQAIKRKILCDPISELQTFPYIGRLTAAHLAKNLGWDLAKPDRHLARFAEYLGFSSVRDLCNTIADATGEAVNVIDLILWRYLSDQRCPEYNMPAKVCGCGPER
jgi:hypothetical protein